MKKLLLALIALTALSSTAAAIESSHSMLKAKGDYLSDISRECKWSMKVHRKWNTDCDTMYAKRVSLVSEVNSLLNSGEVDTIPQRVQQVLLRGLRDSQEMIDYSVEAGFKKRYTSQFRDGQVVK